MATKSDEIVEGQGSGGGWLMQATLLLQDAFLSFSHYL